MKIFYDHQIFSQQRWGGVSRYFHEIATRIPALEGDQVEVFAPLHVNQHRDPSPAPNPAPLRGIVTAAYGWVDEALGSMLVRPRRDIDVFHSTYYSSSDYAPKSSTRFITVFDMIHEIFPQHFGLNDSATRNKRSAVSRADHIICISRNTQRDLVDLFEVPVEKTSVVYLGSSFSKTVLRRRQTSSDKPYILYVGARGGYKNFVCLLRAYASSAMLTRAFALVCFGGGAFTAVERALMRSSGLAEKRVIQVAGDDLALENLYLNASVFVYPSEYEGFGIPPLEAMALGCPVICANSSSLPEVVGDAAMLFNPNSVDELRFALEHITESTDLSTSLTKKGYERAKLFSWDTCARETLKIYKNGACIGI